MLRVTADQNACTVLCVEGRAAIAALTGLLDCIDGLCVASSSPIERIVAGDRMRPVSTADDPVLAAMTETGEQATRDSPRGGQRRLPDVGSRRSVAGSAQPFARRTLGRVCTLRDLLTSSALATALALSQMSACVAPGNLLGLEGLPQLAVRLMALSEGRVSISAFPSLVPRQLRFDMVRAACVMSAGAPCC